MALTQVTTDVIANNTISSSDLNTNIYFPGRNRIINGAMMIDQRNAGASISATNAGYMIDRWVYGSTQAGKFTAQQTTTAPVGFKNSLKLTTASAVTIGASDSFAIEQRIEGLNCSDLGFGSSDAKTLTLSFWVRSSLTGTFGGYFINSAFNRSYPFAYTISSADTWEQKTVTVAGDTSGTWLTTNGIGIRVGFSLGSGSNYSATAGAWTGSIATSVTGATSVVGTLNATFYITGVQLEEGTTATSFEHRLYGQELALCQRYAYPVKGGLSGFGNGTTVVDVAIQLPVEMRAVPTVNQGTLTYKAYGTGGSYTQSAASNSLPTTFTQTGGTLRFQNFSSLTGNAAYIITPSSGGTITTYACILTAEL